MNHAQKEAALPLPRRPSGILPEDSRGGTARAASLRADYIQNEDYNGNACAYKKIYLSTM